MSRMTESTPEVVSLMQPPNTEAYIRSIDVVSDSIGKLIARKIELFNDFTNVFEPGKQYSVDRKTFNFFMAGPLSAPGERDAMKSDVNRYSRLFTKDKVGEPVVVMVRRDTSKYFGPLDVPRFNPAAQHEPTEHHNVGRLALFGDAEAEDSMPLRYVISNQSSQRSGKIEVATDSRLFGKPIGGTNAVTLQQHFVKEAPGCGILLAKHIYSPYSDVKVLLGVDAIQKGLNKSGSSVILKSLGIDQPQPEA